MNRRPAFDVQWRLTWTAALATFLSSLAISPTVSTGSWLTQSIAVILVVAVTGGVCRQLRAPRALTLLATTGAMVAFLTATFARETAVWGLVPGPAAWDRIRLLLADGATVVWSEAPPVPATPGTSLLVVAGVGVVAVTVDALAVTWRRTALAGLPLLAVYLVPAAVLPEGVPWPLFALSAVGWLLLLLVESKDRLGRWGRTLVLRSGPTHEPTGFQIGGTGRRLGAVAVVVAVALPVALPALGEGILGFGSAGTGGDGDGALGVRQVVTVNPIVDLRRDLRQGADSSVLTYTTTDPSPEYLRLATLDRFDGTSWVVAATQAPFEQQASSGLPDPPGLLPTVTRTTVVTQVAVSGLQDVRLPVPYPTTQVDVAGDWRYDAQTLDVFTPQPQTGTLGLDYRVTSLDLAPTVQQLQNAPAPAPGVLDLLAVPSETTLALRPWVDQVTAGAQSSYAAALAIQNWFRTQFTYSLKTRPGNSTSALQAFLADRSGYCEQFAATMALMARMDGIPSRVVVGFTPGSQLAGQQGTWVVTAHDAHAWPELWFEGVGWVRFEPTPGGGDGSAAPGWAPPPSAGSQAPGSGPASNASPGAKQPLGRQFLDPLTPGDRAQRRGSADGVTNPLTLEQPATSRWRLAALVVLVRRRRRTTVGGAAVEAAWAEVRDTMADVELQPRPQETTRDLAARLAGRRDLDPAARAAVGRLADAVERSRYAPAPAAATGSPHDDAGVVTAALLDSVDKRSRRRAQWWPLSSRQRMQARTGRAGQRVESALAGIRQLLPGGSERTRGRQPA